MTELKEKVVEIATERLRSFENHPFKIVEDNQMMNLQNSIQKYGILNPLIVKSKFLKLNSSHIEYAIECLKSNVTKVRNIKKYLLATLFNAPSTISGFFQAEINHDMPQYVIK